MRNEFLPGEQVIVATRPQPRTLIFPALVFVAVPALAAYASAWIIKGGPGTLVPLVTREWTVWLVGACVVLAAWALVGCCLPRVVTWQATRYILTNQRLIARYGVWRRREEPVPLAAVRQVVLEQSWLQRLLRSGNIFLETGHPGGISVPDVPEAATFRTFLLDAMTDLPDPTISGVESTMSHAAEVWPWEAREGGRDER